MGTVANEDVTSEHRGGIYVKVSLEGAPLPHPLLQTVPRAQLLGEGALVLSNEMGTPMRWWEKWRVLSGSDHFWSLSQEVLRAPQTGL